METAGFFLPGLWETVLVLLLSWGGLSSAAAPPPLPEDPALARVAPEECVLYVSSSGTGRPDPQSSNRTERLLAEPQIQNLLRQVEREVTLAARREARGDEKAAIAAEEIPRLIKVLLTHPLALFVSRFAAGPAGPEVEGALVVSLGEEAPAVRRSLESMERLLLAELRSPAGSLPPAAEGWHTIPLPPPAPQIVWGIEKEYLVIAAGEETARSVRSRLEGGDEPSWLEAMKRDSKVPRISSLTYVDARALLAALRGALSRELAGGPPLERITEALGLDRVVSLEAVSGLDDTGSITRTLIRHDGPPAGLLAALAGGPLSREDLEEVPGDSTLALLFRLDPMELYAAVLRTLERIDVRLRGEFTQGVLEIETELGFRLQEDLFEALGGAWRIFNSPGAGGLVITGLTAVVDVKDSDRLRETLEKITSAMARELNRFPGRRRRYELKQFRHEGERVELIDPVGDDWVVAPAWCLTARELVIAPYPQMVRAYLSRKARGKAAGERSLGEVTGVAELFQGDLHPTSLSYVDVKSLAAMLYPLAHGLATLALAELQGEGLNLDVSVLPDTSAILPHLSPAIGATYRTENGIVGESRHTLPLPGGMVVVGAAMAAILFLGLAPPPVPPPPEGPRDR